MITKQGTLDAAERTKHLKGFRTFVPCDTDTKLRYSCSVKAPMVWTLCFLRVPPCLRVSAFSTP